MEVKAYHRVNFYDTDAMGVVHHANYIRWFEIGRVEFLRALGITLDDLMAAGYVFPLTDVSAKFVAPGKFDDELAIVTRPTALTKVKMAFDYEVGRTASCSSSATRRTSSRARRRGASVNCPKSFMKSFMLRFWMDEASETREILGARQEVLGGPGICI